MVFSSLIFLFAFLPLVILGNLLWKENNTAKNAFLLFASLLFYAWGEGERVLVMLISIGFNFMIGLRLEPGTARRKAWLIAGIVLNLGVLSYFKYAFFFAKNLNLLLDGLGIPTVSMEPEKLPIGISFYTFQALSYLVDVYRGTNKAQRSMLNLGLYITLFPQLIAGPIVRYNDMAEQLIHRVESQGLFAAGLRRFIIGFAKKILLANSMGSLVDGIFALPPHELSTPLLWAGMIAYSLQLYFDFSGYSDMAIGLGKMFGFNLPENFNFPYIARSIQDFWRRWHMTLSVWFRDYLYIPLGGNRVAPFRVYVNLFIVFLLTGLWHGAGWNFIVWGLLHGFFLILERLGLGKLLEKAPRVLSHLYTLLVVGFAWILFRADSFTYAAEYLEGMVFINEEYTYALSAFMNPYYTLWMVIGLFFTTPFMKQLFEKLKAKNRGVYLYDFVLLLLLFLGITELMTATYNPFIYFRF